jgi:rRNA maturation protein Nop10
VKRFGKYRRKLWKDMKNKENMESYLPLAGK